MIARALLLGALAVGATAAPAKDVGKKAPGAFDYYVLSLSWEPGFCATTTQKSAECSAPKGFALHGLWPELEGGDYPSSCAGPKLTAAQTRKYAGIYAAPSLITHEWMKHGTCSGLGVAGYFNLAVADEKRVVIPAAYQSPTTLRTADIAAVQSAFVAANPGMPATGVKAIAQSGYITEVEVCLTKAGAFRGC